MHHSIVCMRMRTRTCDAVNFRGDHYHIGQATPLTSPPFPTWQHGAQGNARTGIILYEMNDLLFSLQYHPGFGSEISTEALPGALPKGQVPMSLLLKISLHHPFFVSNRTTPKYVRMLYTVSSCQGQRSLLPGRPTRGPGSIASVPLLSTLPSLLYQQAISLITSITGPLIQTR